MLQGELFENIQSRGMVLVHDKSSVGDLSSKYVSVNCLVGELSQFRIYDSPNTGTMMYTLYKFCKH